MKNCFLLIFALLLIISLPVMAISDDENDMLYRINQDIDANRQDWIAGQTGVSTCFIRDPGLLMSHYGSTTAAPAAWPTPNPLVESMTFPTRFDWRENGGYTPARQQGMGDCFPCWAFSLIGGAESAALLATGIEMDLSEQQLLDCNANGYGCDGGFINGWTALRDYGLVEESCYPYIDEDGDCLQNDCSPVGWIAGAYPVPYSINSLKYALLYHGALSCSMTVYNNFMFYTAGCYENAATQPINHGVIIVGWDDAMCGGTGAWFVKNSWGTGWGDEGVAYMKYGTCNIGRDAQWFEYSDLPVPDGLHYSLYIPSMATGADDWFVLERRTGNPGTEALDVIEVIILDACGGFWFYPDFTPNVDWVTGTIQRGQYRSEVLLAFQWPAGVTLTGGLRFWGACFDAESFDLLAWNVTEWGSFSAL
ncbi:hypothetical protein JW823_00650 [bacterium]|nr:hypothetical protein [candidate division CSSED10-310 bacterium]